MEYLHVRGLALEFGRGEGEERLPFSLFFWCVSREEVVWVEKGRQYWRRLLKRSYGANGEERRVFTTEVVDIGGFLWCLVWMVVDWSRSKGEGWEERRGRKGVGKWRGVWMGWCELQKSA